MARTIKIALPKEFVLDNFMKFGMCADIAIHKGLLDKSRKPLNIEAVYAHKDNPHAHIIVSFHIINNNRFYLTKTQNRYTHNSKYLVIWRKEWARLQNREFERLGLNVRISHESLAAQGINRVPTKHLDPATLALEKRGVQTERGDEYRETIARNREREMERQRVRQHMRQCDRER